MKTIQHIFQLNLSPKEVVWSKRILAGVMLPIFMFYMTSMNFLIMGMMQVRAEEPTVEVAVDPAPAPKEEPKVEEKIVPEVKTEVKTEEPKTSDPAIDPASVAEVAPVIAPANETQNNAVPTETAAGGGPVVETQLTEGVITPEAAYIETVVEKTVAEEVPVAKPEWQVSEDKKTADIGPVELEVAYKAPQNDKVTVTFTKLPEKTGKLTIKEIKLTAEEQQSIGALSDTAYDITSDTENGTFAYNLTLPYPDKDNDGKAETANGEVKAGELRVLYTEGTEVKKDELKNIGEDKDVAKSTNKSGKVIELKGLDHFTIFLVTTINPTTSDPDCSGLLGSAFSCFNTITAAVAAAPVDGSILVKPGTYTEDLTIDKNVKLELVGNVEINGTFTVNSTLILNSNNNNYSLTAKSIDNKGTIKNEIGNGNIILITNTTGNLTAGHITSVGDVTLTATLGNIKDDASGAQSTYITGTNITLSAPAGSIGTYDAAFANVADFNGAVDVALGSGTLSASALNDVAITEVNDSSINTIDYNLTSNTEGKYTIFGNMKTGGNLTVDSALDGNSLIRLVAGGSIIVSSAIATSANTIGLYAKGNVTLNNSITAIDTVTVKSGFDGGTGSIIDDGDQATYVQANNILFTANSGSVGIVTDGAVSTDFSNAVDVKLGTGSLGATATGNAYITEVNRDNISSSPSLAQYTLSGATTNLSVAKTFSGASSLTSPNGKLTITDDDSTGTILIGEYAATPPAGALTAGTPVGNYYEVQSSGTINFPVDIQLSYAGETLSGLTEAQINGIYSYTAGSWAFYPLADTTVDRTTTHSILVHATHLTPIVAGGDVIAPNLTQTTPVPTLTNSNTPSYTFTSNETGTISYAGGCSSTTTSAIAGANTIAFGTLGEGLHNTCTIIVTDAYSNASTPLAVNSFTVDTLAPTYTINTGTESGPVQNDVIRVTVADATSGVATQYYGFSSDTTCDSGDTINNVFTSGSDFTISDNHTDYLCVKAVDVANNTSYQFIGQLNTDNTAPQISNVTSNKANGYYKTGEVIDVLLTFNGIVNVNIAGGTPTILLETGTTDETASYVSGSGSDTLLFNYTVLAGDTTADLDYTGTGSLTLNSGTIKDIATNDANLALVSPGAAGSLGDNKALVIDTTNPLVGVNNKTTNDTTPFLTGTWADANGLASIGITINSFLYSAIIDYNGVNTWGVHVTDALVNGVYNVVAAAIDFAGNIGNDTTTDEVSIDNVAPVLTKFSSTTSDGNYGIGSPINVTVEYNKDLDSGSHLALTLDGGGTATLSNVSGHNISGTYTVVAGQNSADLTVTAITHEDVNDTNGNNRGDSTIPAGNNLGDNAAIVVDGVAPTVALTYSTNPAKAGVLTVTATYSEAVASTPNISIDQPGSTDIATVAMTPGAAGVYTYAYTVNTANGGTYIDGVATVSLSSVSDAAGNAAGAPTGTTFTIDTTAPSASITSPTADVVVKNASGNVNFTFDSTGGATCEYEVNGGSYVTLSNCASPKMITLADGRNSLVLKVTDTAGNYTESAAVSFVVDRNDNLTVRATGEDFTTIQEAITKSTSGDTIQVAAGDYTENLTVTKSLTIKGAGVGTVITGNINTIGDNVTIQDLKITNSNSHDGGVNDFGIKTIAGKALTLENVTVDVLHNGVYMTGDSAIATALTINHSAIKGYGAVYLNGTINIAGTLNNAVVTIHDTSLMGTTSYSGTIDDFSVLGLDFAQHVNVVFSGTSSVANEYTGTATAKERLITFWDASDNTVTGTPTYTNGHSEINDDALFVSGGYGTGYSATNTVAGKTVGRYAYDTTTFEAALASGAAIPIVVGRAENAIVTTAATQTLVAGAKLIIEAPDFTSVTIDAGKTLVNNGTIIIESGAILTNNGTLQSVSITGDAKYGQVLTAAVIGITNAGTPAYQWKRNGVTNIGTNASTYTLVTADIGSTITATAIVTGITGSITSAGKGPVANADQTTLVAVATPSTVVYGATSVLSTTGGSGTGAVTYNAGTSSGCSISGSTLSVTNASGTCAVTATKAADANYNSATSAALTVILQKASSVTAVTCSGDQVYTGSAITPCTVSVTGAGGLSIAPTPNYTANTNIGTVTVSYTYAGDDNHTSSSDSKTFAITTKPVTVTAPFVTKAYDGGVTASGVAIVGDLASGDVVNVAATLTFNDKNIGTGNKTVTPSAMTVKNGSNADMTSNYNITYTPNTVSTIAAVQLTPSIIADDKPYDGNMNVTLSAQSVSGMVNGETDVTLIVGAKSFSDPNVGLRTATASDLSLGGANAGNYVLAGGAIATDDANITAKPITVTAEAKNKERGNPDPALTYTFTPALIVPDVFTGTLIRDVGESVGTFPIKQGSVSAGTNYAITYAGANLTISDTIAPTVTIAMGSAAFKIGETTTVTFTFSEAPTGFDGTDVTVGSGSIGTIDATNPLIQTATFTPAVATTNAVNVITVGTGWTDVAGNTGVGDNSPNYTVDTVAPTVALTYSENPANAGVMTVTATYSEAVASTPNISIDQQGSTDIIPAVAMTPGVAGVYTYAYTVNTANGAEYKDGVATVSLSSVNDTAGNAAGAPTGTTFTIDTVAPTLSLVHIASNNATATLAKIGDIVTLTFTSSENVQTPTVTIATHVVTATQVGDAEHWTASCTMTGTDVEGVVPFTINFTDLAGNAGTEVVAVTDASSVTFDKTVPTLTTVTITSNNSTNTNYAKVGNEVTITFTASETLNANSTATISGNIATVAPTANPNEYTAKYTMASGDTEGVVPFNINFTDLAGNAGTEVTSPTDGSIVTFDKTNPDTPEIRTDEGLWYKSKPTSLDIDFSDDRMLQEVEYKLSSGGTWRTIQNNINSDSRTGNWDLEDADWSAMDQGDNYYLYFRVTDKAGNTYTTPNNNDGFWFRKDTVKPDAPTYDLADEGQTFGSNPTLDIDFSDDWTLDKVEYKVDAGGSWNTKFSNMDGKTYTSDWSLDISGLSDGTHYIYFQITDDAGNVYTTANDAAGFLFYKNSGSGGVVSGIESNGGVAETPIVEGDGAVKGTEGEGLLPSGAPVSRPWLPYAEGVAVLILVGSGAWWWVRRGGSGQGGGGIKNRMFYTLKTAASRVRMFLW